MLLPNQVAGFLKFQYLQKYVRDEIVFYMHGYPNNLPTDLYIYTGSAQICPGLPKVYTSNLHYLKDKWKYEANFLYAGRHSEKHY